MNVLLVANIEQDKSCIYVLLKVLHFKVIVSGIVSDVLKSSLRVGLTLSNLYDTHVTSPINIYSGAVYRNFMVLMYGNQGNAVYAELVFYKGELSLKKRKNLFLG